METVIVTRNITVTKVLFPDGSNELRDGLFS
jgi:hypothetical protein